ncbi:hypothetical protein D3C76_1745240 [compost metagenome]
MHVQEIHHFLLRAPRHQVHCYADRAASRKVDRSLPAQLKNRRSGQTVIRKLDFAGLAADDFPVDQNMGSPLQFDAGQTL